MNDNRLWLGIDGGGTRSEWLICDDNETIIEQREGPALQASVQTIPEILDKLKSGFLKYDLSKLSGICVGLAGLGHPEIIQQLEQALAFYVSGLDLIVNSDAHITHRGTFDDEDGILVITGTGSIIIMRENDKWYRKAGWGPKIGDPASGSAIGLAFIQKILHDKLFDKYHHILKKYYNADGKFKEADLIRSIYSNEFSTSQICPDVIELAKAGDQITINILEFEIKLLVNLMSELFVINPHSNNRKLALHGGLINDDYFLKQLKFHILERFSDIEFVETPNPSALSACRVIKNSVT